MTGPVLGSPRTEKCELCGLVCGPNHVGPWSVSCASQDVPPRPEPQFTHLCFMCSGSLRKTLHGAVQRLRGSREGDELT